MIKLHLCVLSILFSLTTFSQNYEIYVSDAGNFNNPPWQILKFDEDGTNPQVFINSNLGWPQDILFLDVPNVVLISNLNTNTITMYDAVTGQYIDDFATGIGGPTRMKIGADSLLYVLQWSGNGKVLRYDLNSNFIDEFTSIGIPTTIGIDWDSNGNLFVSSYTNNLVHKFDTSGNDLGIFIGSGLAGPTNIWFDSNDNLYVLEFNGGNVKKFDSSGNFLNDFITGLNQPEGVAHTPSGSILIGDGGTSSVKEFDSGGMLAGTLITGGAGNLIRPNAVVLRSIATSSVNEIIHEDFSIIPTIGTTFNIEAHNSHFMNIKIFDILGVLITKTDERESWNWNAEKYAPGVYFINITFKSGRMFCEKVIVADTLIQGKK